MKQKATAEMFEAMGLGAQPQMVEFMVTKIVNNLKYWADAEEVLSGTLGLFLEVSSGGSGKTLLFPSYAHETHEERCERRKREEEKYRDKRFDLS